VTPATTKDRGAALVTGAGHGIGRACAERLAADGYEVVAVDVDGERLAALPASVPHRITHDVAHAPESLVRAILDVVPACPTIVNNVGVSVDRPFLETTPQDLDATWRTNVAGPLELTRLLVRHLIDHGRTVPSAPRRSGGSVVFMGSLHSHRVRMFPDYSATKAAISMLVVELAAELGPLGIRVNMVSPGSIDTWADRVPDAAELRDAVARCVPLRRVGLPEDVAKAVAFLCDANAAAYVTGTDLRVDGGLDSFNWLHALYGDAEHERQRTKR
jgi:NAD(P)-dependent dehydrogenase (short-subunit alcohol dehydrogenase family)